MKKAGPLFKAGLYIQGKTILFLWFILFHDAFLPGKNGHLGSVGKMQLASEYC